MEIQAPNESHLLNFLFGSSPKLPPDSVVLAAFLTAMALVPPTAADHVEEVAGETRHGEEAAGPHQEQTAAEHRGEVVIVKNTFLDVASPNDMKKLTQPRSKSVPADFRCSTKLVFDPLGLDELETAGDTNAALAAGSGCSLVLAMLLCSNAIKDSGLAGLTFQEILAAALRAMAGALANPSEEPQRPQVFIGASQLEGAGQILGAAIEAAGPGEAGPNHSSDEDQEENQSASGRENDDVSDPARQTAPMDQLLLEPPSAIIIGVGGPSRLKWHIVADGVAKSLGLRRFHSKHPQPVYLLPEICPYKLWGQCWYGGRCRHCAGHVTAQQIYDLLRMLRENEKLNGMRRPILGDFKAPHRDGTVVVGFDPITHLPTWDHAPPDLDPRVHQVHTYKRCGMSPTGQSRMVFLKGVCTHFLAGTCQGTWKGMPCAFHHLPRLQLNKVVRLLDEAHQLASMQNKELL